MKQSQIIYSVAGFPNECSFIDSMCRIIKLNENIYKGFFMVNKIRRHETIEDQLRYISKPNRDV